MLLFLAKSLKTIHRNLKSENRKWKIENQNWDKGLSEIEGVKSKYQNLENRCQNQNWSHSNQIKNRDSTNSNWCPCTVYEAFFEYSRIHNYISFVGDATQQVLSKWTKVSEQILDRPENTCGRVVHVLIVLVNCIHSCLFSHNGSTTFSHITSGIYVF